MGDIYLLIYAKYINNNNNNNNNYHNYIYNNNNNNDNENDKGNDNDKENIHRYGQLSNYASVPASRAFMRENTANV